MGFKKSNPILFKGNDLAQRLNVKPGKKTVLKSRKEQVINEFNDAVSKGASEQFLKSLYRHSKQEIEECNSILGLMPRDGLSRLKWSE